MLLNRRESLSLFNRLMFSRDNNLVTIKFIEEVAALAGGLPLVLEVWSRYFIGHERKQWPSLLEKLKRIPHGDVQKQLQMSYDSLSVTSKNLFLDIACFFDSMVEELVVKVLHDEESAFFPDIEIQHLVVKFLVKVMGQDDPYVMMNQVIKEMGHEVVRLENPEEPGQRTRLMGHRDVVRILTEYSGTDSVRSIKLDYSDQMEEQATVPFEAIRKMSGLRFIKLHNYKLHWSSSSKDDMSCFSFKHLKYLQWHYFPCKSLDNIDMGNVVVIKLPFSKMEKLWDGVKILKKLKILDVSHSRFLTKTGNFTGLENLEKLDLYRCENLEEFDSSISCLHQLITFELSECTNLKSIPDLPPNIEILFVTECLNLVNLPSNISELQNLKELWLNECFELGSEAFTQVTGLRNLQELHMEYCNVSQVSSGIGNLVSLRHLSLSGNTFPSLPESFSNLSKLECLVIEDCSELRLLPPLPSQLENIYASKCWSLDFMPFDLMQKAYSIRSETFKEPLTSTKQLFIGLSVEGEELPEWCTYRNNGNVLSFVAPIQFDSKICSLILCAVKYKDEYDGWTFPVIYNKTKGTSHRFGDEYEDDLYEKWLIFYPLNDTTFMVEAGDIVEVEFDDAKNFKSGGLRLVYEDDVVDTGLVLKDVREPLFPTSEMSAGIIQLSGDDDVHVNDDDELVVQNDTNPTLTVFPSPQSEILSGITHDMEVRSFCIHDYEYPCYDFFNYSDEVYEFQMY